MEIQPSSALEGIDTKVEEMTITNEIDEIINSLTSNDNIVFKSQQRGDADPTPKEKADIAFSIYEKSKLNFLMRFGKFLNPQYLAYFEQFSKPPELDHSEICIVLKDLLRCQTKSHQIDIKNRRYEALKHLVKEDSYFSEIEMMKRNPCLYEQLVGQYMTDEEKRERDKYGMDENVSFVKILMEGIERDSAEANRKLEEENECSQMDEVEEESSSDDDAYADPKPSTSMWGEFEEGKTTRSRNKSKAKRFKLITAQERCLLREEFVSTMYQNFLDGKDEDFDYEKVDNDTSFYTIEEMEQDDEDKYFAEEDSEENEGIEQRNSSEDELDIYMNALNQHPAVTKLAEDIGNRL